MNTYKLFLCILCIATANNGLQATDNTVTYDLNSDGGSAAFTNDFTYRSGTTNVGVSTTGGLSNSGKLDTKSGSGNQLLVTKASYSPLTVGQTLSASLCFKFSPTSTTASSIKLGFVNSSTPTANNNGYPDSSSCFAYYAVIARQPSYIWPETYGRESSTVANNIYDYGSDYTISLTSGSWYTMTISLTKTAASTFTLTFNLYSCDSDGTIGSLLDGQTVTNYVNASLDTTLYAFIGLENPGSTNGFDGIDNITMTSQSSILGSSIPVVPEPSAYALYAGLLSSCVILMRRRR